MSSLFGSILPGNGDTFESDGEEEEEISDSHREDTTDGDGENTEGEP